MSMRLSKKFRKKIKSRILSILCVLSVVLCFIVADRFINMRSDESKLQEGTTIENTYFNQETTTTSVNIANIKVGDTINYSPSGTYIWNGTYATSDTTGTVKMSSAPGESYNIATWKVLSVDGDTGKIEMVPTSPTTGTVKFQGAQGYNNAVYILNKACSELYGDSSRGITARSIAEEDLVKAGGTTVFVK